MCQTGIKKETPRESEMRRVSDESLENLTASINRVAGALEELVRVHRRELEESREKRYGIVTTH